MLDAQYRPMGLGGGEPKPPLYPMRLRALIFAFGQVSLENDIKMAGGKVQSRGG
jgi:hypothetical protein